MKQKNIVFALFFLLLGAFGCGTADNPVNDVNENETQIGTLQVEVEKIDGVSIHLRLLKGGQLMVYSMGNGSFEIDELVAGDYTLQISADGYQTTEQNITIISGETVSLETVTLTKHVDGPVPGEGLMIGTTVPDFELPDGNGDIHSLSEHIEKGKKVVIVFYRTGG